jgi:hypothetical protein
MTRKSNLAKKNQETFSRFANRKRDQTPTASATTQAKEDAPKCKVCVKKEKKKVEEKVTKGNERDRDTKNDSNNQRGLFNIKRNIKKDLSNKETREESHKVEPESEDPINNYVDLVDGEVRGKNQDEYYSYDPDDNSCKSIAKEIVAEPQPEHEYEPEIEEKDTEEIIEQIELETEKDPNLVIYEKIAKVFKEGKEVFYSEFGEPEVLKIQPSIPTFTKANSVVVRVEVSFPDS